MRPTMRPFLSVWRCILPSEIKEGGGGGGVILPPLIRNTRSKYKGADRVNAFSKFTPPNLQVCALKEQF